MAPRIFSPADLMRGRKGQTFVLYGPPGHGKTTLIASAKSPLIMSVDPNGITPLIGMEPSPAIIPISSLSDAEDAIDAYAAGKYGDRMDGFIDTATVLQKVDSFVGREEATKKNASRAMKPSQNEWTDSNRHIIDLALRWLLRSPANSGRNLTFVCHQRIERNSEGVITGYSPDLLPQTMSALVQLVSGVFYYKIVASNPTTGVSTRKLYTRSEKTIALTKTRYGIPGEYTDPKWSRVTDDISEWLKSKDKKTDD